MFRSGMWCDRAIGTGMRDLPGRTRGLEAGSGGVLEDIRGQAAEAAGWVRVGRWGGQARRHPMAVAGAALGAVAWACLLEGRGMGNIWWRRKAVQHPAQRQLRRLRQLLWRLRQPRRPLRAWWPARASTQWLT